MRQWERVRGIQDTLAEMSKLDDLQLELLIFWACVGMLKMVYNLSCEPTCWIEESVHLLLMQCIRV